MPTVFACMHTAGRRQCFHDRPASVHHTITHTHTLNSPLSGTTLVSRHQKGKTNLDFNEARDSEWQWHQLGHMQVCTSLQTDNHTSTEPLSFYRLDALPAAQPTASKHWRQPQHHFYLISFLLQFNMIYSSQNCRLSHISFAVMQQVFYSSDAILDVHCSTNHQTTPNHRFTAIICVRRRLQLRTGGFC